MEPDARVPVPRAFGKKGRSFNMSTQLVTGACGCIGAWVLKTLLEEGHEVVAFDLSEERHRIDSVLDPDQQSAIRHIQGDVSDPQQVADAIAACQPQGIIHLAGMQVPSCKADPVRGAMVNIVGTLNILEAARAAGCERVVYASSAAVYGPPADGDVHAWREDEARDARTHYGVYKTANEGAARVFWHDHGLSSVGLRPLTVYGVGRDFGLTSGPTTALKSALLGRNYEIGFTGPTDFQYVEDIARIFVRCLDEMPEGAHIFNPHGESMNVAELVTLIDSILPEDRRGLVSCNGPNLPIPGCMSDDALSELMPDVPRTPLAEGLRRTYEQFAALQSAGRLDLRDLPEEVTS